MYNVAFEVVRDGDTYMLRKSCAVCGSVEYDFLSDEDLTTPPPVALEVIKEYMNMHEACVNPAKLN
jgi:hypothetical protein